MTTTTPTTREEVLKLFPVGLVPVRLSLLERLADLADGQLYQKMPADMVARTILTELNLVVAEFRLDVDQAAARSSSANSEAPLPCPFCQAEAHAYGQAVPFRPTIRMCRVVCTVCEAHSADYPTPEDAISAWNLRPSPPGA